MGVSVITASGFDSSRDILEKSPIIVKIMPVNAPPDIIQNARLERLAERTFLPETAGKMHRVAPNEIGTKTVHIAKRCMDEDISINSLFPDKKSVCINRKEIPTGISMIAPKLISAIPGLSEFSMNESSPLIVMIRLEAKAINGTAKRAIMNDPPIKSFLEGSSKDGSRPKNIAESSPDVKPIGLRVKMEPASVIAVSDLDQSGLPEPKDAA